MIQGKSVVVMVLGVVLPLALAGCTTSPSAAKDSDSTTTAAASKDESKSALGRLLETRKEFVIPEGTTLRVTIDETLSSNNSHAGDLFAASTSEPVIIDGNLVIPKGARVSGRVVDAKESGRLHVPARLAVALNSIEVDGKSYDVQSSTYSLKGRNHNKRNLGFIGGGAAGGALIGGLAGGGAGALIGSAVGAGAGTAGAAATGKKDITLPAETRLSFRLQQPVSVSVRG
jgi:outer membrane lipoprotein SlyB